MSPSPAPPLENSRPVTHRSLTRWVVGVLGLTVVSFVGFSILYADNGLTASHRMFAENFNGWMVAQIGTLPLTVLGPLVLGTLWASSVGRRPRAASYKRQMVAGSLIALMMTLSIFGCFVLTGAAFTLMLEAFLFDPVITWSSYATEARSVLVDPEAMQRLATALALSGIGGAGVGLGLARVRRKDLNEWAG